jgi:hypothetical protein
MHENQRNEESREREREEREIETDEVAFLLSVTGTCLLQELKSLRVQQDLTELQYYGQTAGLWGENTRPDTLKISLHHHHGQCIHISFPYPPGRQAHPLSS